MFPPDTRILIVEDIPSMLDVTVLTLKALGFNKLITANDGAEALGKYQQALTGEPFGVIISDWNMPNMNGIVLLEEVRNSPQGTNLPFLLLTTESEKSKVVEAIVLGVSNYMVKPISEETLKAKLKEIWLKHQKK